MLFNWLARLRRFGLDSERSLNLESRMLDTFTPSAAVEQSAKQRIEDKIRAAEIAIADVMKEVAAAVVDGDIKANTHLYGRLGCAQDCLNDIREKVSGKKHSKGSEGIAAALAEAMMRH